MYLTANFKQINETTLRSNRNFTATDKEWERIKALAAEHGMDVSQYARMRLLPSSELPPLKEDGSILANHDKTKETITITKNHFIP